MMDKYEVIEMMGEGAHGIVLKARSKASNNELVALKKVALKKVRDEGVPVQILREIKALQYLKRHENVVRLLSIFPQGFSFVMVFEFLPSNLWEILETYELNGPSIKTYLIMMLKGLEFIHSNHIMHRDLKPSNLLISNEGVLKIADFGLCRLIFKDEKTAYSHQVATRWYRAPELLYGARFYDETVDIWSIGCIFAEMLNRQPLFKGENDIDQLYKVISSLGTPNENNWPGVSELPDYSKIVFSESEPIEFIKLVPLASDVPFSSLFLQKFINYDSAQRISAHEALNHEFFKMDPLPCSILELPPIPTQRRKVSNSNFIGFDESFSSQY